VRVSVRSAAGASGRDSSRARRSAPVPSRHLLFSFVRAAAPTRSTAPFPISFVPFTVLSDARSTTVLGLHLALSSAECESTVRRLLYPAHEQAVKTRPHLVGGARNSAGTKRVLDGKRNRRRSGALFARECAHDAAPPSSSVAQASECLRDRRRRRPAGRGRLQQQRGRRPARQWHRRWRRWRRGGGPWGRRWTCRSGRRWRRGGEPWGRRWTCRSGRGRRRWRRSPRSWWDGGQQRSGRGWRQGGAGWSDGVRRAGGKRWPRRPRR